MKFKKHLRKNSEKLESAIKYFYPKYDVIEKGDGVFSILNREGDEIYEFWDVDPYEKVYKEIVDLLPELKEFLPVPKTEALELNEIKEEYGEDIYNILKEKLPTFKYYLVLIEYEYGWGCIDEYHGDKKRIEIDYFEGYWVEDGFGALEKEDMSFYEIYQFGSKYQIIEVFRETDIDYNQRFPICGSWDEVHIEIPEDVIYYTRYIPVEEEDYN